MMEQQEKPQPGAAAQQASAQSPCQGEEVRSLWIGDLRYWMNEEYLKSCFPSMPVSTKVIRNKQTGQTEGYGFIQFATREAADKALQTFHGTVMPQSEQLFRLNWASFGLGDKRDSGDHSIFVGDLAADVTDAMLLEKFRERYPSVKAAKVVTDGVTGRAKGYGFVRFGEDSEKNLALNEMNGVLCSTRPMRVSLATPKKAIANQQLVPKAPFQPLYVGVPVDDQSANTTIFVGNLDQNTSDSDLRKAFSPYGEISYIKIPPGKACGFVQFTSRAAAEEALLKVHGTVIGNSTVRLSWGRSPSNKQRPPFPPAQAAAWCQPQFDAGHQWNYYTYNHAAYDGSYGYVFPHDPAFYSGYQGPGTFPQQVN